MSGTIRIIAGKYKGRKLSVLDQEALRPTPNRIRETLFNWLMHDIQGSDCLDAFAGTGALGFEALSRGAKRVTLIENNPLTFNQLQKTATAFQLSPSELSLIRQDSLDYLRQSTASFDLIFLDPPFQSTALSRCLESLTQHRILKPNGLVYIESQRPLDELLIEPTPWENMRLSKAGEVYYGLFRYAR